MALAGAEVTATSTVAPTGPPTPLYGPINTTIAPQLNHTLHLRQPWKGMHQFQDGGGREASMAAPRKPKQFEGHATRARPPVGGLQEAAEPRVGWIMSSAVSAVVPPAHRGA
jgi:hypothetical protein